MDNYLTKRRDIRKRRVLRIRKHVRGTAERPRLSVYKTNKHISVQLIDDENSITIASAGTLSKDLKETSGKKSKEAAKIIGAKIAELAKAKQVVKVVFDRGRLKYHGVIAELASAAREAGLQF